MTPRVSPTVCARDPLGWWDLSPMWARVKAVAHKRDSEKNCFKGRDWCPDSSHLVGLAAEMAFALETGLKVNTTLRRGPQGDDGYDFRHLGKTYDVKASQHHHFPSFSINFQ